MAEVNYCGQIFDVVENKGNNSNKKLKCRNCSDVFWSSGVLRVETHIGSCKKPQKEAKELVRLKRKAVADKEAEARKQQRAEVQSRESAYPIETSFSNARSVAIDKAILEFFIANNIASHVVESDSFLTMFSEIRNN